MIWMRRYYLREEMRTLSAGRDSIILWEIRMTCKWFSLTMNIYCHTVKLYQSISSHKLTVVPESWITCICTPVLLFLPFPFQWVLQKHRHMLNNVIFNAVSLSNILDLRTIVIKKWAIAEAHLFLIKEGGWGNSKVFLWTSHKKTWKRKFLVLFLK